MLLFLVFGKYLHGWAMFMHWQVNQVLFFVFFAMSDWTVCHYLRKQSVSSFPWFTWWRVPTLETRPFECLHINKNCYIHATVQQHRTKQRCLLWTRLGLMGQLRMMRFLVKNDDFLFCFLHARPLPLYMSSCVCIFLKRISCLSHFNVSITYASPFSMNGWYMVVD